MENFTILLGYAGIPGIIIIVVLVLGVAGIYYIKHHNAKRQRNDKVKRIKGEVSEDREAVEEEEAETAVAALKSETLGHGRFKCLAFRPGNIADFTTIPKPIGEAYLVDTSCPSSGTFYIVKELPDGQVVDYDPRKIPFVVKNSPSDAWHATHWQPETSNFWTAQMEWWKSKATIFAVAMMLILFIKEFY